MASSIYFLPSVACWENRPPGTIIFGQPGQGKTFFLLNIAANCLAMGQKVIAIDPKDDMMKLKNIDPSVKIININNIEPGSLNPFTFLDDIDTLKIQTLIEIMLGTLSKEEMNSISFIIEDFITGHKQQGEYVDMQDLTDYLHSNKNDLAREVGKSLRPLANSQYGKLLFTRNRNVNPLDLSANSSFVISLLGLPVPPPDKKSENYTAEERFTSAIIYLICKKLETLLATRKRIPTTIFADEAHAIYSNESMAAQFNNFLRLGRSLNYAVVLATQSVNTIPKEVAQYISNKFIFKSSRGDAEGFLDLYDNSDSSIVNMIDTPSAISGITNLDTGHCFYIDFKNRSGFIKITSNYDTSVFTSNVLQREDRGD